MPRDFRASENTKRAKAKRQAAIDRPELLQPTTPRRSAAGPTSMAIKDEDPETRRLIDDAIARRSPRP